MRRSTTSARLAFFVLWTVVNEETWYRSTRDQDTICIRTRHICRKSYWENDMKSIRIEQSWFIQQTNKITRHTGRSLEHLDKMKSKDILYAKSIAFYSGSTHLIRISQLSLGIVLHQIDDPDSSTNAVWYWHTPVIDGRECRWWATTEQRRHSTSRRKSTRDVHLSIRSQSVQNIDLFVDIGIHLGRIIFPYSILIYRIYHANVDL